MESPIASSTPAIKRKNILKNSNKSFSENSMIDGSVQMNGSTKKSNGTKLSSPAKKNTTKKPQNIEEFIEMEKLNATIIPSTFNLEDLSDNEDVWIMEFPETLDPQDLCGHTINFDDKSKLKINDERFYVMSNDTNRDVPCIFKTKQETQYKTKMVKSVGSISIRKKVSQSHSGPIDHNDSLPFFNLQSRDPIYGIIDTRKKREKRKRKPLKLNTFEEEEYPVNYTNFKMI